MSIQRPIKALRDPLNRAFSLPRLPREYHQADAVVFWPKFWRIHGQLRLPDAGNIKRPPLHENKRPS